MTDEELIAALQDRVDQLEGQLAALNAVDVQTEFGLPRNSTRRAVFVITASKFEDGGPHPTLTVKGVDCENPSKGGFTTKKVFHDRSELIAKLSVATREVWEDLFPSGAGVPPAPKDGAK